MYTAQRGCYTAHKHVLADTYEQTVTSENSQHVRGLDGSVVPGWSDSESGVSREHWP